jgi:hypothetical protein
VAGRLAALVAAMAGLMAAGLIFVGQAGAIVVPPPPDPVEWSLFSNVTGQCLNVVGTSQMTTNPCNGSESQKFQTLYNTGYAEIRNVATQLCVAWTLNTYLIQSACGRTDTAATHWLAVAVSTVSQWQSPNNFNASGCLGTPQASAPHFWAQLNFCSDSTTFWHPQT